MRIHTHARAHTGTRGQTHARACTACTNGDPYFGRFSININMQLYIECGNDMEGTSEWNISAAMSVAQDHYMPNVCACTRARASAVPLCTTAVPHRTAAEHIRLRWRAPGRKRRTHTWYKLETRAVFHAPMFALNADAPANACEPNHTRSMPTERACTVRRGYLRAQAHKHTRTHTPSVAPRVSVIRCS